MTLQKNFKRPQIFVLSEEATVITDLDSEDDFQAKIQDGLHTYRSDNLAQLIGVGTVDGDIISRLCFYRVLDIVLSRSVASHNITLNVRSTLEIHRPPVSSPFEASRETNHCPLD